MTEREIILKARMEGKTTELINRLFKENIDLQVKLNPRFWTKEMSDAWHSNIPDLLKAFEALREYKPKKEESSGHTRG